jgi:ribosome-associated protein
MDDVEDLVINHRLTIPGPELVETFATSGGPGGQHANRAATRVRLAWGLGQSAIDPGLRRRLERALAGRLVDGELRVVVDDSRSQWRNRQLARKRLASIVVEGLRPPPPPRRPTRPSRRQRRERLSEKRRRSEIKRLRDRPARDD